MTTRWTSAALLAVCCLGLFPGAAQGQNIVLKTLPIPTGEQFLLFPSRTLGMGSTTLAVDDRDALPFTNPALRLSGDDPARLYATPTFYGETNRWVGGRSLPLAALVRGERIHGGFAIAVQQVQDRRRGWWGPWGTDGGDRSIQEDPSNTYVLGTVGARLTDRWSIGVSGLHATLGAVDGVNMLYGRARAIEQDGTLSEVRLGFAGDLGAGRALDATITTTRVDITHDVRYTEWVWDPANWTEPPVQLDWTEVNEDHTITWGTRIRYTQPVGEVSRLGLLLAGSTKNHPKIPNYNVVDIPRDPGNSAVFNFGIGTSRTEDGATLALEAIFEPGRSHTWALAEEVIPLPSGAELQPGAKTVDNQFRFRNWSLGIGFEQEIRRFDLQLGLRVRQVNYSLDQHNYLAEVRRQTRESWMEWSPSWSGLARLGAMEFRYAGRFTAKGWPDGGMVWWGGTRFAAGLDAGTGVDFVVGPTGVVNIPAYRVTTHRFSVSVPFGM
jgi:hypothetical protein